ncbi:MAG TPA: glycoside hydrolase domain-containing protein [Streptosporangiaceae bacterium]|nr:glycoside hydrolase domain-containing protein [Streptosporangiaceae bacterium]
MVVAIVWQKRALAVGAVLAATTLPVAGATAAASRQSPGDRGGRGVQAGAPVTLRQVSYMGYTFGVPSNWPVINLAAHPAACVRFDRHAFYVGQPGTNQACPSGLIGSTEAVLVAPAAAASAGAGPSQATEDPVAHRIVVSAPRITVTASYQGNRPQVLAILKSAGLPSPVVENPAGIRLGSLDAGPAVPLSATNSTGLGFDACAAPEAAVMSAWLAHSSYQAIGIYIGGSDRACLQPNLTAAWVSQQAAAGWHFIPLYVGPQVSFKGEVTQATSQAISAAQDAAVQARTLGFGAGTPIYYDMEAYSPGRSRTALKFFTAWTIELHTLGYKSAIYSSSDSGISDLASNYANTSIARPDVIYDALWNGIADTSDANVPGGDWANHQRVHQFSGNISERHGGYRIAIDQDYLDVQLGGGSGGGGGGHGNGRPTRQASRAVSTTGRAVDSFFAGGDRALWSAAYQPGQGWSAPVSLGGTLQGQPSAVTTATGMMVFFRGAHGGRLHYVTASGGNWSAVQELSMGPMGTAPRAVSTDSGNVYVFWRGVNPHQLWSAHYAPASGWHGPALLASGLGSQPSPAVSGGEKVNVFWKGTDGQLWHISRSLRHSWRAPSALPMGQIGAAPHATAQHNGEIDVFWGGATAGSVWRGTYAPNTGWGNPQRAGGGMAGQLIVVGSTPSTESAFWKGSGGLLWRSTSQGAWGPAAAMPLGTIGTKLAAVGQSNGVVDVFWRGSNHHLWHSRFYPQNSTWTRPHDLGGSVR